MTMIISHSLKLKAEQKMLEKKQQQVRVSAKVWRNRSFSAKAVDLDYICKHLEKCAAFH